MNHKNWSSLRALEPRGQKEARAQVALQSLCLRWGHRKKKKKIPAKWLLDLLDIYQWIGWRENLQEKPIAFFLNGKIYGFRLRFSLIPIHYNPLIYVQHCPHVMLRKKSHSCSRCCAARSIAVEAKPKEMWPVEPPWCLIPYGNLT